jgi:aspartate carbamoyltransferase
MGAKKKTKGKKKPQRRVEMDLREFAPRMDRPVRIKAAELQRDDRLKHVIFSDQFTREMLDELGGIADMIRVMAKSREGYLFLNDLLRHKRAMLYFTQPSTRTFLSFMAACQILGITCNEVRDPSTSSETKGESRFDSIRTFSSYFDVIIMRTVFPRLAECCAYLMNDLEEFSHRSVPIINGGSGADEHPTQALLDIYTLQRTFQFSDPKDSASWNRYDELRKEHGGMSKGLGGKVYGFCGDIGRGRTVRSLATLLTHYDNVTMIFVAPDHSKLALRPELRERLIARGVRVVEVDSLEEEVDGVRVIERLDALYMTRIQTEHDDADDAAAFDKIDFSQYKLRLDLVKDMKPYAAIMHPFPRDQRFGEIPPEIDNDPRAMYFRQARNGMWVRAAVLAFVFGVDRHIARQFQQQYTETHDYNEDVL